MYMYKRFSFLFTILVLACCLTLSAGVRNAKCVKAKGKIVIDGKLDEPDWKTAPVNPPLVDLFKCNAVSSDKQTTFKVLFDERNYLLSIK